MFRHRWSNTQPQLHMPADSRRLYRIALLTCMLMTCATGIPAQSQAETAQTSSDFPAEHYRQAKESGQEILHIDPAQSFVVIEVHRAGPAGWLGHDHVVACHDLSGYVSLAEGQSDLLVPLDQLVVDEPELRLEAGFDTQPSEEDIRATRRNMLKETLDSERFPYAYIHIDRLNATIPALKVSITLHGITRTFEVQAKIEPVVNGIVVAGGMSFKQTDFGIIPLSVFGGAIQVNDKLDLRFRILAQKK